VQFLRRIRAAGTASPTPNVAPLRTPIQRRSQGRLERVLKVAEAMIVDRLS
jgi:hypothetical protein